VSTLQGNGGRTGAAANFSAYKRPAPGYTPFREAGAPQRVAVGQPRSSTQSVMDPIIAKAVFFAGLVMTNFVIRFRHIKEHHRRKIRASYWTWPDRLLFSGVSVGYLGLPLLYIFTPWLAFADYTVPTWIGVTGIVLLVAGNWLFWKSHRDLGSNWSPGLDLREGHQLVTAGVYRRIRHPMYAALWLIVLAQAMILPNVIAGFSGLAAFGLLYFQRVHKEERMMVEQFGTAYEDYLRTTGRLLPRF
jgi:protein-S-isoprenylcysteine O-methyltransferase Ste14